MLALYRSGRHAEALAVYEQLRRRLDDDLGLQPSADLQQLSARMVRQEQELDIAGPTHAERAPSQVKVRARRVSGLVAAGAAAAAVMALTAAGGARQLEATGLQPARIAVVLERPRSTDRYAAWRADEVTSAVGGVSSTADADAELLHVGGDPQPSEVARVSRRLAAERFDLVLFALSTHAAIAFAPVVAELPRTRSVFIDTTLEELALAGEPNATAIRFATEGPAQLAGALSGLIRPRGPTSERPDTVSVLVSDREPEAMRVVTAFRRGVVRARPNATVRIDYTSETFDPTACEHAANAQIDAGADVVFVHSGHCGTGALAVARARGVPTISGDGVSGPEGNVLASIFKDWDNAVYSAVGAFKSGVLPRGENVVLSLDGYNVGLDMNATLPKGIASKVVNLCTDVRLHVAKPSIPTLAEP
jgi:basic membrane lipoprotein Med (substrate-binding protein (PBP1-ABC) superfamily)